MLPEEIADFAKVLVKQVRDSAIRACDSSLHAKNLNAPTAKRWRDCKVKGDINEFAEMIIADTVDQTLFQLFQAIDEHFLDVNLLAGNGRMVNLTKDGFGELSGWYIGDWRFSHSSERSFNDFPNE